MSITVIIPAHNEQNALPRCLAALAAQDHRGPAEIIVAANGCVDGTVAVAQRSRGSMPPNWRLRVLELPAAAKWAALNAADAAASAGILVFLDADIVLGPNAIGDIAAALSTPEPRLVQPRLVVERTADQHPAVRSFVRVWSSLPYVKNQVLGVGCYAVNAPGRRLWGSFPPLGADDTFVRLRFGDEQKAVLATGTMGVCFPSSLLELIRVRARWCRLSRVVRGSESSLPRSERRRWLDAMKFILSRPSLWVDGIVFSAIWACAVSISRLPSPDDHWARADSADIRGRSASRSESPPPGSNRQPPDYKSGALPG
jgi:glycosyltransferase involved in cell wall biosynthesis